MICDCIQPATGNDCCCPYCFSIIHLLRGLKKAYQVKDSLSKKCDCDSCKEGSITRTAMENMSEFRAACLPCGKVLNGTKLPSDTDAPKNYKLNCCLEMNSTEEGVNTVFHYDKQYKSCGIKNVMPPPHCLMWETESIKYQRRHDVTLNAHGACRANGGAGLFAEKFVCVDQNFSATWNHLNEKTADWLHHKYID
jgi:hypothetical protein